MTCGAVLSFGLAHVATSEFELMAEELLMSDSVVKASEKPIFYLPLSDFVFRIFPVSENLPFFALCFLLID